MPARSGSGRTGAADKEMIVAALKRTEERITHVINTGDGVDQGPQRGGAAAAAAGNSGGGDGVHRLRR